MADEDPIEAKTPVDALTRARYYSSSKNRFTQEFEEWNDVTGALPKGIGWYYECQSIFEDADKEIDRLCAENERLAEESRQWEKASLVEIMRERDRLRAENERLTACFNGAKREWEIAATERDRLRAALARWESGCTGKHGSQAPCNADETSAPQTAEQKLSAAGVFKGAEGLRGLARASAFWEQQPYGTRLYYGEGGLQYLHRSVLETAVDILDGRLPVKASDEQDG